MQSIKEATISGFNELMQSVRNCAEQYPEQEHFASIITFNGNRINTVFFNEPIEKLPTMDMDLYKPDDRTPLFDAMGQSINRLRKVVADG